jgi:hypothetical protein
MDILNWLYLAKNKFVRATPGSVKDLMIFGAKVGTSKRGDLYQNYAMSIEDFSATLPTPGPVVDEDGNLIVANSSPYTVDVANGAAHLINDFSGMLLVNDHFDGSVELWVAGGGDTIAVAGTNTGGGPVLSTLTIASNGYEWTNVGNLTGPFTFTVIKTRTAS